ncbi:solute carrier family 22 member 6-B-like [Tropilaelaps mercedesae]|uniref:Solute carrier family 22 member 6-B-like n=1 Tax=Tropilaelaps mercedesae TaxID=418985 RepID=A0A1V9XMM9_9ACAR|nr:solute carrier family 22 member 6-B-like [Tropilaelaps mercedesae]
MAWTNMMSPLMAADVPHWCAPPNSSIPEDWWRDNGVPRTPNGKPDECQMFKWSVDPEEKWGGRIDREETVPCTHGWVFNHEDYGNTATEEWLLVCGDAWKRSAMQSVIMAGSFVGVVVCGRLSDKFGRKFTFIAGLCVLLCTGISAAFAPTFASFNAVRCVMSASISGLTVAVVTLFMEIMPEKDRIYMNVGFGIGYAIPLMLIPLLSYYLQNFRHMQLAIGLSGLTLIPFVFILEESPKWLLAKHQLVRTEKVIVRILNRNRRPVPDMSRIMPKLALHVETESAAASKNLGFVDLVKVPVLRRNLIFLGTLWFSGSLTGYYMALNAHRLPGNAQLNFAISTLSEFPSAFIGMYLLRKCRRRQSQMVNLLLAIVTFSCVYFIDDTWASTKVWGMMIVRFFLFTCGFVKWVNIHEINPTPARSAGFAMCMMCSRVAAMIAPFLKDIGDWTHHSVPYFVFVALESLSIWCIFMLPETLHKPLPDTIENVKSLRKPLPNEKCGPQTVTQNDHR